METIVRDGKFFTVGDTGAGFYQYKKGDIIFNHKQTEELFANGKVTSGGGRGKAFVEGTAFVKGGGKFYNSSTGESYGSTSDSSSSDSSKDFEEVIDWIEVIIDRVERSIDKFDQQANNIYKSWSSRNNALLNQISEVNREIGLQQQAKNKYMSAANGVGLSSAWATKVRNGAIDINTIKDEALAEKIKSYQDYYEKALDCEKAIRELQETESSLYRQRFDNVQSQYDAILQGYEHTESMLNEYINQAEEKGLIVSRKYYDALISNEKNNISELKKEQSALLKARDEAVASGTITKQSEDWYDMCAEIDSVTQAIEEGTTALIEYNNALRDIEWEKFDLIQQRISDITAESEFLIELLSNKDLFDDNGKITNEGKATIGLHAQNYNTHMYQSDDYAKEIAEIDKQLAKAYDGNLEERRRELIELQRESILAAEDEKQAIKDLIEEGINAELDALQERIDLHNDELDSMKDLYDYQKRVEESSANIASLRKQMSAYENDNSEEAKAKLQELKVSLEEAEADLEETEWDRYIDQQAQLLDQLYTEYELVLNERIDNIDAKLQGIIDEINADSVNIQTTLTNAASDVGTSLSNTMSAIWSGDGNAKKVVDLYGTDFQSKLTTTNAALDNIKNNVAAMTDDVDKDAKKNVSANKTTTSAKKNPTGTTSASSTTTTNKTTTTNTTKSITVGGMVNASGAQIYDYAGDTSGERQYYRNDPKYKVLKENGNWIQVRWHKLSSGITGWFKKGDVKAYKTGAKNLLNNELAWTQENGGKEFIVRPSDGAILTPLAKGDSVLNANASGNIWNMANNPADFIKDNLNLGGANVPNSSNVNNNITQHIDANLNFPNVKSYEEMLVSLSRDPKFQKLVNAMTTDQYLGKSSLTKGKVIK